MDNKEARIWVRVTPEEKKSFKKICKERCGLGMSAVIRLDFIQKMIKRHGNGK